MDPIRLPPEVLPVLAANEQLRTEITALRAALAEATGRAERAEASAREKVHRAFKIRSESGQCQCPYCTGDLDGLGDMVGNYELDLFAEQQKRKTAEAECAALKERLKERSRDAGE